MTVTEALKKVKDGGVMAYREAWRQEPLLKDSGIIWSGTYGYCYWYKNVPRPERYADDDPRVGVDVDSLTIANIMAEDWEVETI